MLSYFFGVGSKGLKALKDLDVELHDEVKLLKTFSELFNQLHTYLVKNQDFKDIEAVGKHLKNELKTVQKIIMRIHSILDDEDSKAHAYKDVLSRDMVGYDGWCGRDTYDPTVKKYWFPDEKNTDDPEDINNNYRAIYYLMDALRAFSRDSLSALRSVLDKKISKKEDIAQIALWMVNEISKVKSLSSNIEKIMPVFEDYIKSESIENKNAQETKKRVMSNEDIFQTKNLYFHGVNDLKNVEKIFKYGIMSVGLFKRVFGKYLASGWNQAYSVKKASVHDAWEYTEYKSGCFARRNMGWKRASSFVCLYSAWANPYCIENRDEPPKPLPPSGQMWRFFVDNEFQIFFMIITNRKLFVVKHDYLLDNEVHLFGRIKPKEIIGVCTEWNLRKNTQEFVSLLKLCMKNQKPLYRINRNSKTRTASFEIVWPK